MIQFSDDAFFKLTLLPGTIFYFENKSFSNSNEPHYHVLVSVTPKEMVLLTCITSQIKKKIRYIEKKKLPESTLIFLKPDSTNGLKVESAVNCNDCYPFTKESLKELYNSSELEVKGKLKASELEQIKTGLKASPLIENEIKNML